MPVISLQNPLDQPRGRGNLLDHIRSGLIDPQFTSFKIIVAFAKQGPLRKLESELRTWIDSGKKIEAIIGIDENGTSFEALDFALKTFSTVWAIYGKGSFNYTFHPKIFLFEGSGKAKVFIGSNNLTVGGTERNSEAYVCIDMAIPEDKDLLAEIKNMWDDSLKVSKRLDKQVLSDLKVSGLVLDEKDLRGIRLKTQIAIAETDKKPDLMPRFPKIPFIPASYLPPEKIKRIVGGSWEKYARYIEDSTAENINLYWNISKKNNHLDVHLWALNLLIENDAEHKPSRSNDRLIRETSKRVYPHRTMEGNRALIFSKLIGLLISSTPFRVSDAYRSLRVPEHSTSDALHNAFLITSQLEKFYFWNDIFSPFNRHTGGKTKVSELFHLYPIFFLYDLIIRLAEKGYGENSLSKFEVEAFASFAKDHSEVDEVVERIVSFRKHNDPEELQEYLQAHMNNMDSRFYRVLQYSVYFNFDSEIVALKPKYLDEIKHKVASFNSLRSEGKLIEFEKNKSDHYRDLLFSSRDLISYHSGL